MEAWHAVTGKIPILWTEAALGAGVGRSAYEKWLRWYEKEIRNGLWWSLLEAYRLQQADLADANGGDNVIGYSAPEFYIGAGVSYIQSGEAEIYFTT